MLSVTKNLFQTEIKFTREWQCLNAIREPIVDIILGSTVFFPIKITVTSQNSQKSQNLVTLWFSRRFPGETEKKLFLQEFPGGSQISRSFQECGNPF